MPSARPTTQELMRLHIGGRAAATRRDVKSSFLDGNAFFGTATKVLLALVEQIHRAAVKVATKFEDCGRCAEKERNEVGLLTNWLTEYPHERREVNTHTERENKTKKKATKAGCSRVLEVSKNDGSRMQETEGRGKSKGDVETR